MSPYSQLRCVTLDGDVLVIGGGAAGLAAATAAGRLGARVVLLERNGFLGGLATAAHVGTVAGLFLRDTAAHKAAPVAGGFPNEFAQRLERATGRTPMRVDPGLWVLPYSAPAFMQVADAVVNELNHVTVVLHATVSDSQVEDSRRVQVRALAWNEPLLVWARAMVDCTGEATAAALGGAAVENGSLDQAPAVVFTLENLHPSFGERGLLEVRRELHRGIEQGRLPAVCDRIALLPGTGSDGHATFKLNLRIGRPDRPAWQQVSASEREARTLVDQLHRFLVQNTASCRNARLAVLAPQLGIRSGRRIHGRARLADDDVLSLRKSKLGIARGCWPMERWGAGLRPELTCFDERGYYEIPLDCLRPASLDNVWVAGRCICATAAAMSSARVIGTALATGWAAGTVAAFQALERSVESAVESLRQQLEVKPDA